MTQFRARVLTAKDQPIWRALRVEALTLHPAAFLTTAAEQNARTVEQDCAGLDIGNWWGLFEADALVGLAVLIPMRPAAARHRMEIGAVYVRSESRGTGAARFLMTELEGTARAKEAKQLELDVAADNERAIRFYDTLGYVKTGLRPRAIWTDDGPQDDLTYVKFLDAT